MHGKGLADEQTVDCKSFMVKLGVNGLKVKVHMPPNYFNQLLQCWWPV